MLQPGIITPDFTLPATQGESYLSPIDINPGADGILQALDDMNNVTQ